MEINYAVSPGDYLQEEMEELGKRLIVVSTDLTMSRLDDIIGGADLTPDEIVIFGDLTRIRSDVWSKLQKQYTEEKGE